MRATTMVLLVLSLTGCATTTAEPQAPAEPEPQPTPEASNEEAPAEADVAEVEPVEADAAEAEPAEMAPEESPAPNTQGLHWTISAHPARLTMAQRARFRLRRSVTNRARETRDALHSMAEFTLTGESSMTLNMAFGNGARESLWAELPPGRTVFDEREMGESLFPAPGTYRIEMTVEGETSSVTVVVRP